MTYTPAIITTGVAGYRTLREERDQELERVSEDRQVKENVDYFRSKISAVSSAEELLADRRLLEVALTAYGLEDEIDNKAFVKRALEEGTDQEGAFANRTSDARWKDFAGAFGFGDADAGLDMTPLQAEVARRARPPLDATPRIDPLELAHFRANVGDVETVDDLLADSRVLDVALEAFGLERGYFNDDHFRQLLDEGVADQGAYAYSLEDSAWVDFAAAFSGLDDGSVRTVPAFRLDVERELARRDVGFATSDQLAADPDRFSTSDLIAFQSAMDAIDTPEALVADAEALKTVLHAYGLENETATNEEIIDLLDRAAAGDVGAAELKSNRGWAQLAQSWSATVGDGAPPAKWFDYAVELAIAENELEFVPGLSPEPEVVEISDEDLAYFMENAGKDLTVDALLADERMLGVALEAFGLGDEGKSDGFVRSILEDDLTDAASFVNTLSDSRWRDFAQAFQGGEDARASVWLLEIEDRLAASGAPSEDIAYLRSSSNLIESNLDFVLDPKLMDIVTSAFGLGKGDFSDEFFISMIISNPNDPNSLVNLYGDDRWADLVDVLGSFKIAGGNTALQSFQDDVVSRYETKIFEIAVGEEDQNLRLALNFERLAAQTSAGDADWFAILGDQPLRTVVDGALGLPNEFVNLDIESQNEVYKIRMNSLFGDGTPAALSDPNTVQDLITRFLGAGATTGGVSSATPGYGALTLMQSAATRARSFGSF